MSTYLIAMAPIAKSAIIIPLLLMGVAAVIAIVWLIVSHVAPKGGTANIKWIVLGVIGAICFIAVPPLGVLAFVAASTGFWIWMLVDCAKRISAEEKDMLIWLIVLVLTHFIGTLIYFFVVYRERPPPLATGAAPAAAAAPAASPPDSPPKVPAKCPKCGTALSADAPEGLCPRCLVQMNLAATAQATGASVSASVSTEPLPSPDSIAANFPQLEILECLGRGGMGVVYKARQPRLDRIVALKILAPGREKDPQFAERFMREARALAKLNHQNIVTVYDFGESGGLYFLLMEYVDGVTLRGLIQGGKLDSAQALSIVPRICEALQSAHEQGVVHRDIKPENVLVDKQGRVKIADFGIARIVGNETGLADYTKGQAVVGTPYYMAPEQVEKPQTVDHRADIYSLGVVFYEMLTGELPMGRFARPSEKVQVDVRLDEVVLRALEKEPQRRYQQASHVKTDVEHISTSNAAQAAPPPLRSTTPPFVPPPDVSAAMQQVRLPALALRIAGILFVVMFAYGLLSLVIFIANGPRNQLPISGVPMLEPMMRTPLAVSLMQGLAALAGCAAGMFIMRGAGKMQRLESRGRAVAAAWCAIILGALSFMTMVNGGGRARNLLDAAAEALPFTLIELLGVGIGIWVLAVLLRPMVRAGFASRQGASQAAAARAEGTPFAGCAIASGVALALVILGVLGMASIWSSARVRSRSETNREAYARGPTEFTLQAPVYIPDDPANMYATAPTEASMASPESAGSTPTSAGIVAANAQAQQLALEAQLHQAQSDLARLQQQVDSGMAPNTELNALKEEVDVLKAEQTGDPVRVAEARAQWAQKKFQNAERTYQTGLIAAAEYEAAKNAVELSLSELQAAQTKQALAAEEEKARATAAATAATTSATAPNHTRDDLRVRLQATKLIGSWSSRDAALNTLAQDAASADETAIVIEALSAINSWSTKDGAARAAARTIAHRGHRAEAIQVAKLISSAQTRDATLSELSK